MQGGQSHVGIIKRKLAAQSSWDGDAEETCRFGSANAIGRILQCDHFLWLQFKGGQYAVIQLGMREAEALVISERTVVSHLTSIFNKTRVDNRAAATAFAIRHGLVE